ncbi:MAG: Holliday junction resolvase RuvX, partial [Chloroflexi bacterium]|nr:Holliday junction resolvase RuvX [Chloroflexota bacterium]
MRFLGIDHGDVRIGLALSDETGLVARPFQIIKHTSRAGDAETIVNIAAAQNVSRIIVGLPTGDDGQTGHQGRKVQRWAEALAEATSIPIEFWDESLSSVEAGGLRSKRKGKRHLPLDAEAAALILQSYLDA